MSESSPAPNTTRRPNVIVILADDMGYGDLSAYGNDLVQTAHIDSIGRDGVTFTAGYSSAPLCSPSCDPGRCRSTSPRWARAICA